MAIFWQSQEKNQKKILGLNILERCKLDKSFSINLSGSWESERGTGWVCFHDGGRRDPISYWEKLRAGPGDFQAYFQSLRQEVSQCTQVGGNLDTKGYGIATRPGSGFKDLLDQVSTVSYDFATDVEHRRSWKCRRTGTCTGWKWNGGNRKGEVDAAISQLWKAQRWNSFFCQHLWKSFPVEMKWQMS